MQTTSTLYNQIMADINRHFEVKLVIDGVEYGTDTIFSAKTESRIFDNKPTIGGCYAATLDFSVISDGASIPRMASVIPYFRVVNDTQQSEWVQQGLFFIDQRKVTNNGDNLSVFTAECFDAMLKANAVYGTSSLNWPATDTQVVEEIATAIGVAVDPRTTTMLTKGFTIPAVPVAYTYRDILSFIGVVYAGNWIISDEGKLRLVPIGGNSDTLNIDKELMSMNVSPKRNGYTKVVITTSDGEAVESGSYDDMVMEAYCPYATQAIADDILATLATYQYEPFDASGVWSNPAVEVGDKVTAVEKTVVSYARTVNYGPGMVMNLSAPDDGFIDHEYAFESPADRRYTRTIGGLKTRIEMNNEGIALAVANTPIVNLLPSAYYQEIVNSNPYVRNGITWTVNPDGSITATGTATSNSSYAVSGSMLTEMVPAITIDPDKKYYLTGCPANGSSSTYRMGIRTTQDGTMPSTSTGGVQYEYGDGLQVTEERKYAFVYCQVLCGYTCPEGGLTFYPMLEVGETAHAYVSTHEGSGGLTERLYDTEATVSLNSDKIALVVSETLEGYEVNAASIVAAVNESGSSVIISADKVDLEGYVTFSNLKTGGRNLYKGSQYMDGTNSASTGTWAASKFFRSGTGSISWKQELQDSPVPDCGHGAILTATSANTRIGFGQAAYPSLQEGPYTISFWAKGTAGDKVYTFSYYASASDQSTYSDPVEISATGVWQRFSFTHRDNTPGNIGGAYRIGYILFESATAGHTVTICAPKFEYGNVATSWTPAPEDSPTFVDLATPGQTIIDGGNITTNTITADKIAANEIFTQKLFASDFNILGGSIYIEAGGGLADQITLAYGGVKNSMMPYGYKIYDENYASLPILELTHTFGPNYKSALITLREINSSGTEIEMIELKPSGVLYYIGATQKFGLGGTGLSLFDSNGNKTANYSNYSVTLTNGAKSVLENTSLSFYGSGGGLLSQLSQTKLTITNLESVELTNTELVFKNASNAVTAAYSATVESAEYTPSNDTITFLSSSRVYVFKTGTHGTISVQVNIQNGDAFAASTDYVIATLPQQYRPKYILRQFVPNQTGTSSCMISVGTDGAVKLYRYANSGAWGISWIRAEIPAIFANP